MKWTFRASQGQTFLPEDDRISPFLSDLLIRRGIPANEQETYLFSTKNYLQNPFLFEDMEKGVNRVQKAILAGEKIVICGDYDADGVTGTSLLVEFFKKRDTQVAYYIPDRLLEGYGLSEAGVKKVASFGSSLIITVDNGSLSKKEVKLAGELGVDVIITDHHQVDLDKKAEPFAFINPHMPGCKYPCKQLAGVGVVFKLVQGYVEAFEGGGFTDELISYMDIVALGTVADVVPLRQENRFFVQEGLKLLNSNSCRPGLAALKKVLKLKNGGIKASTIAFNIAPRINAAGRVGRVGMAVSLLTGDNSQNLISVANELNEVNQERQSLEKNILLDAENQIAVDYPNLQPGVPGGIVLYGDWHPGVIGIVASGIVEKYFKPTILIAVKNDICRGSARSIPGFHILNGISSMEGLLDSFGGHKVAAGLSIKKEKISEFKEGFNRYVEENLKPEDMVAEVLIDGRLTETDINFNFVNELSLMGPFGMGNSEPVFSIEKMSMLEKGIVGQKHLKLLIKCESLKLEALGFNQGEKINQLDGELLDLCGHLRKDEFRGKKTLKFFFKDFCKTKVIV